MSRISKMLLCLVPMLGTMLGSKVVNAQPSGPPTEQVEVRAEQLPDGQIARLRVTWAQSDEDCSAELTLGNGAPITIHSGPVAGTLVAAHGTLVVAYAVDDAARPFRIRRASLSENRAALSEPTAIARSGNASSVPFTVAAAVLPDGFMLFFQEVEANDPSAAHTYWVRLDQQGVVRGGQESATEVPIPWSLADAAWNGSGYHLALLYPGNGTGMRLSMVSFTEDGRREQHPDWASAAGYIADVHLVAEGTSVRAFYRGGPGGDRLLERDVSRIGPWGREPARARNHGTLSQDSVIAIDRRNAGIRPLPVSRTVSR